MTAWSAPTRAAIDWRAPGTAWVVGAISALVVRAHGEPLTAMFSATVLAAACGLIGPMLDDEARDLLAVMPTGPRRRLLLRLTWVVPAILGGATALLVLVTGSLALTSSAALTALLGSGVAAYGIVERRSPERAPLAPAAFAALWLACDQPLADHRWAAWFAGLWTEHPLPVVVVSVVVTAVVIDV